jgi:hypothetical protein
MPSSDALVEALCWITCGVLAVWGCCIWGQVIGMERALRRAGGMQAWKRGKR